VPDPLSFLANCYCTVVVVKFGNVVVVTEVVVVLATVVVVELAGEAVVVVDSMTVVVVDPLFPRTVVVVTPDSVTTVTTALGPEPVLLIARTLKTYFMCLRRLSNTQRYVATFVAATIRVVDAGLLLATYLVTGRPLGALALSH